MGVGALHDLSAALVAAGWPPSWPAAAISSAWRPEQRIVRATVATLADAAHTGEFAAPATLVFGRTAADPTAAWAAVHQGAGA